MRGREILIGILLFSWALTVVPARATLQQDYVDMFLLRPDSPENLERKGDLRGALAGYQDRYQKLQKIHQNNPTWEPDLIAKRLEDCQTKIAELTSKVAAEPAVPAAQPTAPATQPAIPVAQPIVPAEQPAVSSTQAPTPFPSGTPPTLPQDYLAIYVKLNDSERLEKEGDFGGAMQGFQDAYGKLGQLQARHPDWETVLIASRISDCRAKIAELQPKVEDQPRGAAAGSSPPVFRDLSVPPAPPRNSTTAYPWKTDIITTVFWIGEGSAASSWNPHWTHDNGGSDGGQNSLSGYASFSHASTLNPFYVALPFNDLAYPDKAHLWVPASWSKPPPDGKPTSACKDRWIEIKNRSGRTCFAQWEDVGPHRSDHAEYVFGPQRPDTDDRAGLSVSPAVAKYLGIDPHGSVITSWRFVDTGDVLPGMWLKYDEEAIIFTALQQAKDPAATSGANVAAPGKNSFPTGSPAAPATR